MDKDEKPEPNYYEIGDTPARETDGFEIGSTPAPNTTGNTVSKNIIERGSDTVLAVGDFYSSNFSTGNSGWRIRSNGDVEFGSGFFRGDITGATGTFSGSVSVGSLNIPDSTTVNSFHTDSSGNSWWGTNVATGYATAPAKVLNTGAATFTNVTITGGSVAVSTLNGTLSLSNLNAAAQGWSQTSVFSITDADTIAWAAGTFTTAAGTAYSIGAGNTGNMTLKTYIYLDTSSPTVYLTTTTASTAVGAGKVLVAIAQNGTGEATYTVMSGQGGQNIDASSIVANSISANELSTSILYAGSIQIDTAGNVRSGQTAYRTGTGWFMGNDSGTPKLSIGGTTTSAGTIAFDAITASAEGAAVSTRSFSHTCTGSNRTLFVAVAANDATLTDRTVTSITYNGVALTKIRSDDNTDIRHTEIWYLTAPASGSNTVVVTMGGTCTGLRAVALSLTGTSQSSPLGGSGGQSVPGSTLTASASATTTADGSWIIDVLTTSVAGTSQTPGTNQTSRYSSGAGTNLEVFMSSRLGTTAGYYTNSWSWTTDAWRAMTMVSIKPATSSSGSEMFWDGSNLQASNLILYQNFIAGENITIGQPVGISALNNGNVTRAKRGVALATISYTNLGIDANVNTFCPIGGDKFVFLGYTSAGSDTLNATVVSIDKATMTQTLGTTSDVAAAFTPDTITLPIACCCALDVNKFIVFYVLDASTTVIKYRVATVAGTTISWGAEATFTTAASTTAGGFFSCDQIGADIGIFVYKLATETNGRMVAFTTSGTTATVGTPVAMGTSTDVPNYFQVKTIATNKYVVVTPAATDSLYAQVCTLSGTTITAGTEAQISTSTLLIAETQGNFQVVSPDTNVFVTRFCPSASEVSAVACTVSGTTPTAGSALTNIGTTAMGIGGIYANSATVLTLSGGTMLGFVNVTLSGTTLTEGETIKAFTGGSPTTNMVVDGMVTMENGYWVTFSKTSTNLDVTIQGMSNNYLGIAQATASAGATCAVLLSGIDSNQSNLLAGVRYLVNNGTLSSVASNVTVNTLDDIDTVLATSDTRILIK